MATSRKRYWALILLALGLAETAHAPLMGGARASDKLAQQPGETSATQKPGSETKKVTKPELAIAPVSDSPSPENAEKKLEERLKDLFSPLPPLRAALITPPLEAGPTTPISLLHTGYPDASSVGPGNTSQGGNPVLADAPPEKSANASDSPAVEPTLSNSGSIPVNNNPVPGLTDPVVAVPEPSGLAIVIGSALLLRRRQSHV